MVNLSEIFGGSFIPGWFSLVLIFGIVFLSTPVYALLVFLALTVFIAIGLLIYMRNEFFAFLILFVYSGAITVLFVFLLQFYNIAYKHQKNQTKIFSKKITTSFLLKKSAIIGVTFLFLAETFLFFITVLNSEEIGELLSSTIHIDENASTNLMFIFQANQNHGLITIIVGLFLLIGLIVILCIITSHNSNTSQLQKTNETKN